MEAETDYSPRLLTTEMLKMRIGNALYFRDMERLDFIIQARKKVIEIASAVNESIEEKLQELEMNSVESMTFVPFQDRSIIVKLINMYGAWDFQVTPNTGNRRPSDVLEIKYRLEN